MAVVFVEVINLVKFEEEIIKIEAELKINSFHWSEERWEVRNKFLARLVELDFEVKVAIFKNPANPEKAMSLVFEHLITQANIRNLFIDGKKPKWYEQNLKRELRDKGISVKKLRTVNDKSQPGIQAADCLAGLIRRHYNLPAEEDARKWFNKLVKEKKLTVQLLFEV
ncbi:DUF3800 domain-containing protein [Candidatus Gottesmanbacteria bacterium]|nr:DUF3800 domain-containing protein [Candidatus Gottesmanbacteria bacterium]